VINAGKTGVMLFLNRQTHVLVKPLVTFKNMNSLEDGKNTLSQNLRNKQPTNPMTLPGRAKT